MEGDTNTKIDIDNISVNKDKKCASSVGLFMFSSYIYVESVTINRKLMQFDWDIFSPITQLTNNMCMFDQLVRSSVSSNREANYRYEVGQMGGRQTRKCK